MDEEVDDHYHDQTSIPQGRQARAEKKVNIPKNQKPKKLSNPAISVTRSDLEQTEPDNSVKSRCKFITLEEKLIMTLCI